MNETLREKTTTMSRLNFKLGVCDLSLTKTSKGIIDFFF